MCPQLMMINILHPNNELIGLFMYCSNLCIHLSVSSANLSPERWSEMLQSRSIVQTLISIFGNVYWNEMTPITFSLLFLSLFWFDFVFFLFFFCFLFLFFWIACFVSCFVFDPSILISICLIFKGATLYR